MLASTQADGGPVYGLYSAGDADAPEETDEAFSFALLWLLNVYAERA